MATNTNASDPRRLEPGELERWLWTYEAGLLESDEEAALAWHIAGNPAAAARLEQIRQCFDTVAARSGASLAEARARNTHWAAQLKQLVDSAKQRWFESYQESAKELEAGLMVVAVFAQGRLFALAQQSGVVCAAAGLTLKLGGKSSPLRAEGGPSSQIITTPNGTKMTLTLAGEQKLNLVLELADKSMTGMVELRQVTPQSGPPVRKRLASAPIEDGVATFERCPTGLLEILLPGEKPMLVGVSVPPERPAEAG